MFKLFSKSKKSIISPTGVYLIEGKSLKPLNKLPEISSINNIIEYLGYTQRQVHVLLTGGHSTKILCIVFKKYSKAPIFVMSKEKEPLSYSDIKEEINQTDWEFEWRQLKWEDENPEC